MATDPSNDEDSGEDKYAGWYESTETLWQGSILRNTRVFEESADSTPDQLDIAVRFIDVVLLTQSCDIPKDSQTSCLSQRFRATETSLTAEATGQGNPIPNRTDRRTDSV